MKKKIAIIGNGPIPSFIEGAVTKAGIEIVGDTGESRLFREIEELQAIDKTKEAIESLADKANRIAAVVSNMNGKFKKLQAIAELNRALNKRRIRLDRNGICPCGSGKKYKKCCLFKK